MMKWIVVFRLMIHGLEDPRESNRVRIVVGVPPRALETWHDFQIRHGQRQKLYPMFLP
jgi:hypothetical protein